MVKSVVKNTVKVNAPEFKVGDLVQTEQGTIVMITEPTYTMEEIEYFAGSVIYATTESIYSVGYWGGDWELEAFTQVPANVQIILSNEG